ncbi:MAG: FKBP-type peptidyl-prolyl cis-trans isomerase [Methanobacteriota archaeon]
MVLQNGDFVKINYIGKIKESGKVFDTTVEQVAKENKIYDEKIQFKAVPIVIGAGHVIKGLDEALIGTEVGEKKIIEIPPAKGYGERDPKLVKVVPLKDFKKQGLTPVPGMRVEADGRIGKVQSVGAGRVRVDFNYELAGKVLEYEVNVEEKTNKLEEKIRLLLELHFPYANPNDHEVKLENGKAVIILSDIAKIKQEALLAKHYVARDIFKFLNIKEVEFREVFKKPEALKEEKEGGGK